MSTENLDTQPNMDFSSIQDSSTLEKIEAHIPSPAILRAVALTLASVVAAAIGRDVNITPIVDAVLSAYTILVPAGLTVWFGRKVTAAKAAASTKA